VDSIMRRHIIIVAGGKGLRMGGDIPKQFLPVHGKPILMRTLEAFHRFDADIHTVLVLPADQQDYWLKLCREYGFSLRYDLATGGETRFHSVRNGLQRVLQEAQDDDLVGVHDGVRPFVSTEVMAACYQAASRYGAVIPVVEVVETVRHLLPNPQGDAALHGSETVPRSDYRLVQTPQVFTVGLLRQAYEQPYTPAFTDDASVVEALGKEVTLVPGNRENIKVTTPYDLRVAEMLCQD
jgi:2-C-methyl-D-erythritol 4-phosphate cytidylyltransferase